MKTFKILSSLALLAALASCYSADHFTGDSAQYDGLYFAPEDAAPNKPMLQEDTWRIYAVLGLVPWSKEKMRFAGHELGAIDSGKRPADIYVVSEQTFVNGLAQYGLGIITYSLSYWFFTARSTEVAAWPKN